MRKWLLILAMGACFASPSHAAAQADTILSAVSVQLWPEYDQPSMLVIVDFQVRAAQLPGTINFQIPHVANLIAVAARTGDGSLVNAVFDGPTESGDSQSFTISMDATASYRFEYYQPITFNGNQRSFSYVWDGAYVVDAFDIRVLEPADATSITSIPRLPSITQEGGLKYYTTTPVKLLRGEQFRLQLTYEKPTDALIAPQGIHPSVPVDENTPGRMSLNNSLPYVIGGLGVILIIGGLVYYWQSGRTTTAKPRPRSRAGHAEGEPDASDTYCPQCGSRAQTGDRFCRVCGARLRHPESPAT